MQTTAIGTVAKSLPQNKVILLTHLISNSYIPYTDLRKYYKKVSHVYESVAPQCLNYLRNFGSSNTNVLKCTFYGAGLAGRAAGQLFLSAFNTRRKP